MKNLHFIQHFLLPFLIILFVGYSGNIYAQGQDTLKFKLPNIVIKTLDNRTISSDELKNPGKPMVWIFWKSCCDPNIKMLDAVNEEYEKWQEETGVVVYAISIDDSRTSASVSPLVNGNGWEFQVLLDVNADLKRAMNVNITPHVFIINDERRIVWQKTGYTPGDETSIYNELIKIRK